jgi:hypothetical protein
MDSLPSSNPYNNAIEQRNTNSSSSSYPDGLENSVVLPVPEREKY